MKRERVTKYILDHWNGRHSLSRSFFINGILFNLLLFFGLCGFIAVITLFCALTGSWSPNEVTDVYEYLLLILPILGLLLSSFGIISSAVKILRSPTNLEKKFFAIIVIIIVLMAVFMSLYLCANDVLHII